MLRNSAYLCIADWNSDTIALDSNVEIELFGDLLELNEGAECIFLLYNKYEWKTYFFIKYMNHN